MERSTEFVDLLEDRRRDCDFLWVTRPMDPLLPHMLPPESVYDRERIIQAVLQDKQVRLAIDTIARTTGVRVKDVEKSASAMINEMASKADLTTVRWLGWLSLINIVLFQVLFHLSIHFSRVGRSIV